MANVLLAAYLLIVLALIGVILIQRSEGGGLGIGGGGGGGGGGLMTARGSANLLTRTTAILAALFMATAIGLTVVNQVDRQSDSILDAASQGDVDTDGSTTVLDALNSLQGDDTSGDGTGAPASEDEPNLPVPGTGN